jgi:ribosomal protein L39E
MAVNRTPQLGLTPWGTASRYATIGRTMYRAAKNRNRPRRVPAVAIVLTDGRVVTEPLRRDGILGELLGKRAGRRR